MESRSPRQRRTLGACALALMAGVMLVVAYVLHPSLPYNTVSLPGASAIAAHVWAPQGWKFFTRDAREPQTYLYKRDAHGRWSLALTPRTSLGADRSSRVQSLELAQVMQALPGAQAKASACDATLDNCLEQTARSARIE